MELALSRLEAAKMGKCITDVTTTNLDNLSELYVLRYRKVDERIKRVPSILGRDILNRYKLIYDKRLEKVQITDERD